MGKGGEKTEVEDNGTLDGKFIEANGLKDKDVEILPPKILEGVSFLFGFFI